MTEEGNNRQPGKVIWLTGLSGAGKSTISKLLYKELSNKEIHSYILDGDKIRQGLSSDLGFSPEDREENIRRIGEVSILLSHAGVYTIVAFISPYNKDRGKIRDKMKSGKFGEFIEIFVNCPVEECEKRDPKGLYKKARSGEIPEFTGITAPYENPENPELELRTDQLSVEECVNKIVDYMKL